MKATILFSTCLITLLATSGYAASLQATKNPQKKPQASEAPAQTQPPENKPLGVGDIATPMWGGEFDVGDKRAVVMVTVPQNNWMKVYFVNKKNKRIIAAPFDKITVEYHNRKIAQKVAADKPAEYYNSVLERTSDSDPSYTGRCEVRSTNDLFNFAIIATESNGSGYNLYSEGDYQFTCRG